MNEIVLLRTISILLVFSLPLSAVARDYGCQNSANELRCVLRFYPTIYRENPEYFWKVLNQAQVNTLGCNSVKGVADFLHTVRLYNAGADLEEFVSESVETLCVNQPICFKKAMSMLDKKTRRGVQIKLKNPLYFEASELSGCR